MVDIAKWTTLEKFSGVNNVDVATRLNALLVGREYVFPLQQANNVDIDNTFRIASRPGMADIVSASDIHSLWSNNEVAYFVDVQTLYQLYTNWTTRAMVSGLRLNARMSYAPWNNRVYYTNYFEIGYLKSSEAFLLTDPSRNFKVPLPAGQLIEYYKTCLLVAKDNILYISDPLCDYYDTRHGYRVFSSDITLLRAVDKGLYVGDDKVYWISGDGNDEFEKIEAYSHRAIKFTDVRVNGQYIGDRMDGKVAIWTGDNGICVGNNSGTVLNLTEFRYTFTETNQGSGFVRDINNVRHYINSLY
jgi:hypothetical protein